MEHQMRSLTINVTEKEYQFICEQAQTRELSISKYIALCTIAQDDLLCISALTNQLRQLKYQLKSTNNLITSERKDLLSMQKNIYNMILSLLCTINENYIHIS